VVDGARERVVPMSPLRKTVARRLVEAQHAAAILTTFNEIDMSNVLGLRERHQERFVKQHGIKLGFMSFFVKAVVAALQQVPALNAQIDGDSVVELLPASARAQRKPSPDGMIPPVPMPPDTSPEDRAWCDPLRLPQPAKTFEQKLKMQNGALTLPRHYIYCTRNAPDDRFRQFYERAKREGWDVDAIDSSHNPHITCSEVLADLLDRTTH